MRVAGRCASPSSFRGARRSTHRTADPYAEPRQIRDDRGPDGTEVTQLAGGGGISRHRPPPRAPRGPAAKRARRAKDRPRPPGPEAHADVRPARGGWDNVGRGHRPDHPRAGQGERATRLAPHRREGEEDVRAPVGEDAVGGAISHLRPGAARPDRGDRRGEGRRRGHLAEGRNGGRRHAGKLRPPGATRPRWDGVTDARARGRRITSSPGGCYHAAERARVNTRSTRARANRVR